MEGEAPAAMPASAAATTTTAVAALQSSHQPQPPGAVLSEAATSLLASNKAKRRALGASLESLLATFRGGNDAAGGDGGDDAAALAAPSAPSSSSSLPLDPRFAPLVRRARAQRAALFALSRGVPLSPALMAAVDGVEVVVDGSSNEEDCEPYFYSEPSGALRAAASRLPRSLFSGAAGRPPLTADDVAAVRRLVADRDRARLRAAAAEASRAASGASGGASDRAARVLPAEARLAMLLRARALKLAPKQQALRAAVLADERRARAVVQPGDDDNSGGDDGDDGPGDLPCGEEEPSGDPSLFLAEFSRWRIAAPWQLGAPEHVPRPPRATAEAQEAAAHQAKSEYKHLLRLGAQAAKSMTQAERRAAAAAAAAAAAQAKRQRQEDVRRARAEASAELEAMRFAASSDGAAAGGGHFQQQQHQQHLSAAAAAREAEARAWAAREKAEKEKLDRALALLEAERAMLEQRATLVFEATAVLRHPDPERGLRARRNAEDRRRAQRNAWARSWHGREQRRIAREGAARVAALKGADYGEYLRLARLAKDSRLDELLSRTDAIVDTLRSRVPEQRAEAADVAARKKKARKADRKYKRERRKRLGIFKKKKGGKKGGGDGEGEGGDDEGDGDGDGASSGSDSSSSSDDDEEIEEIDATAATTTAPPTSNNDAFDWEVPNDDDATAEAADDAAEEEGLDDDAKHLLRTQREYYRGVHAVRDRTVAQPKLVTGGTLRSYQVAGLRFMASLVNNKVNGILADEMGLGKTVQTIALVAHLLERGQLSGPHLILAPKAVLPNWSAEFARWAPGLTAVLYDGAPEQRRAIREKWLTRPRSFHALLTHYDLAMRDARALRSLPGGWGLLVVDEGHRLKNADARLATALRSLTAAHRILLTGTPLQNSLAELWALLNFVLPKVFDSAASFDEWFAAPLGDGGGGPGMASPGIGGGAGGSNGGGASAAPLTEEEQLLVITRLHQVLRPFVLRRTKAEVESDLPDKTSRVVRCGLSAWQAAWYRQIARKGRATLGGGSGGGGSGSGSSNGGGMMRGGLRNIAMQLRKVCIHPYLFLDNPNSSYSCGLDYAPADPEELVRASGKVALLDHVLEKLKATGHRVLLFSQMTRALDVLGDFLDLRGHAHLRLDGSTKTEDRARLLAEFNAPDSPHFVFLLSTRAGGLGLNLQSADTVIMFDSDWNPASDAQAEDRAHRIGQTKDVLVLVLCSAGTIEEVILDRAARKRELDAKVIQAGMFNDASTHRERTRALQALLAAGDPGGAGAGDAAGATSLSAINKAIARGPDELAVFKEIDAKRKAKLPRGRAPLLTDAEIPDFARSLLGGPDGYLPDGDEEEDPKVAAARRREELRKEAAADAEAAAAGQRRSRRSKPGGAVSYREPGDNDFGLSSDSDDEGDGAGAKGGGDDDDDAGASEIESLLDSEESDEEAELRAKAKAAARRARKAEEKEKGKNGSGGGEDDDDDDDESEEEDDEDLEVHAAPAKRGRGRPPKNAAAPAAAAAREKTPAAAAAAASAAATAAAKGKKRAATATPTPAAESEEEVEEEEEKPKTRGGSVRGRAPASAPAASKRSRLQSVEEQPAAAAGRRSSRSSGGGGAAAPAAKAATATKAKKNAAAAAPASAPTTKKGASYSSPPASEEPPAKRGRGRPPVSYKE